MTTALATKPALLGEGIYRGVPAAEYHALPYASVHRLLDLARSPLHCRWNMDHPKEQTDDMRLGTAIHTAILEPEKFVTEYLKAGQCETVKKNGERCSNPGKMLSFGTDGAKQWFCGVHGIADWSGFAGEILTAEDYDAVTFAAMAVHSHPVCGLILREADDRELTIVWRDEESGCLCKMRADALHGAQGGGIYAPGFILDIKTTQDASPEKFPYDVIKYRYYAQAAMYVDGARAAGLEIDDFAIIAVEKTAPYGVMLYQFKPEALDGGRQFIRPLLNTWAECQRTGIWPGYPQGTNFLSLPSWVGTPRELDIELME